MGDVVNPDPGVARTLAFARAGSVSNVRYHLTFWLPASPAEPITGRASIRFELADATSPIVLDFEGRPKTLAVNGAPVAVRQTAGHLIVPSGRLVRGENLLHAEFTPDDAPFNRADDFLYTLFVPARARFAFPCFDQPDLRGRFTLTLVVPSEWTAVANAAEVSRTAGNSGMRIEFPETQPIPTYLFAFAAGRFAIETRQEGDRTVRAFHRETDSVKVDRNAHAIFHLHLAALGWLERFTGIPYPFEKLDFVLIPSFQFSGMEHPGAIYYNASSLLLEPSATETQRLARATLIAHEAAHLWFGDLVTMRWFDDVWVKEVLASFLASKIVEPSFPAIDHELRFLVTHYPPAYSVDRTAGTHPIRQELDNLSDAGSLYGAIIYHKSPIVMRLLEDLMTADRLRDGLRRYLETFAFAAADWPELVSVLASQTDVDVRGWSAEWVEKAGRPSIRSEVNLARLPYGDVVLTPETRQTLLAGIERLDDPVARGGGWIVLWEEMLGGRVTPPAFLEAALRALPGEDTELIVQLVTGYLRELFWRFLTPDARQRHAARLEEVLRQSMKSAGPETLKATWFAAFRSMVTTGDGVRFLERVWRRRETVPGVVFGESDEALMALEVALRLQSDEVLDEQLARFTNPDRRTRFEFVMPAASSDERRRDIFFAGLAEVRNRRHEAWVVEALACLNHPLRAASSIRYLRPSLDLLVEIHRTGDIFFPKHWLDATLFGHNTPAAAAVVRTFLADHPSYPPRLRNIVLQSAHNLFRAASLA